MAPDEKTNQLQINNDGELYIRNRATRRQKPPTDNWYTKATHSIKQKRAKIKLKKKK